MIQIMKRILVALASPRARLFRAVPVQPEIPWDMVRAFPPGGLEELLAQHGAIDHLLGTTAAKVVNHADRSVLVVRAAR